MSPVEVQRFVFGNGEVMEGSSSATTAAQPPKICQLDTMRLASAASFSWSCQSLLRTTQIFHGEEMMFFEA